MDRTNLKPLAALTLWEGNYNQGDVEAIARSILRFGFNGALRVWQDGVVMAGNHALMALRWLEERGPEASYPALLGVPYDASTHRWPPANVGAQNGSWAVDWVDVGHLSPDEAVAFAIADNESARRATRDEALLARYLAELRERDETLFAATAVVEDDYRRLLARAGMPADAPADPGAQTGHLEELQAKWGTACGQLWAIPSATTPGSAHRLLCGNCTDRDDVARLMDGARAALFATDPPYLVDYDAMNHPHKWGEADKNQGDGGFDWDDARQGEELYDGFVAAAVALAVQEDAAWYCWHASRHQAMLEAVWARHGAFVHQQIIWVKDRAVLTRSWYMWQHEVCFFGWVRGKQPKRVADDYLPTVWQLPTLRPGVTADHPTSKPVELFATPMRQHTYRGEVCYEPFAGSGSQVVAGEQLGRLVYGLELQPVYVAVILERLAGMGLEPRLVEEG